MKFNSKKDPFDPELAGLVSNRSTNILDKNCWLAQFKERTHSQNSLCKFKEPEGNYILSIKKGEKFFTLDGDTSHDDVIEFLKNKGFRGFLENYEQN